MNLVLPLPEILSEHRSIVGGKAWALAESSRRGFLVPEGLCVTTDAYRRFVATDGLREKIALLLSRKTFDQMRWEELWDASLRIRNLFLTTPIPTDLRDALEERLEQAFGERPVAVRSSAPGEDSPEASFAGLHESFVNVRGVKDIVERLLLVWASLWSDAALLYRKELELDFQTSAMAVVVQELVVGDRSGVVFGRDPGDPGRGVVEAVYGLNQGLVDGSVEPDRWFLSRDTGEVLRHDSAQRTHRAFASHTGVELTRLSAGEAASAPLTCAEVRQVFALARRLEASFGSPQDVEWTFLDDGLYLLQSRPITTGRAEGGESEGSRSWYLSLRRTYENLCELRDRVENELLPAMDAEAAEMVGVNVGLLSDGELSTEITRREERCRQWEETYRREFIPLAHGVRLFGEFYNDAVQPADPYEFVELLSDTGMLSIGRNRELARMAERVGQDPALARALREQGEAGLEKDRPLSQAIDSFLYSFGDSVWGTERCFSERETVLRIVLTMAEIPEKTTRPSSDGESKAENFLNRFEGEARGFAARMLELARESYRLRDDDNVHLANLRGQLLASLEEGKRRLRSRGIEPSDPWTPEQVAAALEGSGEAPRPEQTREAATEVPAPGGFRYRARQIVGQPAGPGFAAGQARVVGSAGDLLEFQPGEILVCDAIDPNMTFVVPMAAGVVERRGGMLIHGAIVAREYGLPCVTGVPDATTAIRTGDRVTVDGYLGIVIVD